MKKIILMAFVACATTVALHAAAIQDCNALGASTFAALESAGSCIIGDKIYSNFFFSGNAVNTTALGASSVSFATVDNGNIANGFTFTFSLTASSGQSNDIALGYDVAINTGSNLIASEHLNTVGSIIGSGTAVVGESVCLGGSVIGCAPANILTLDTSGSGADSKTFNGVTVLGVLKDINVAGGSNGFATISIVSETVDQIGSVPEPMTLSLMGAGLLGIGLLRRGLRKK